MESVQQTHQRPGTITLVVVLAWIAGILNIAAGIFVIIDRHDSTDSTRLGVHAK